MQINHNYTYITSLSSLPPPVHSIPQVRLGSLRYTAISHQLFILHLIYADIYIYATFSIHPTLSLPYCVHKSVLYICVSIPSL